MKQYQFFKDAETTVTSFYLDPLEFDKWMHQNKGEYTGDFVEGCLQDNFVVSTKRGYAFFYERVLNTWNSDYEVYFIPYKSGEKHMKSYDEMWALWFALESYAEEEEIA